MMITHWILKVTDGQAKGLGVWKSRFQSWGRRRVSDPSAKLLPLRGAAQWFQMCKIRHKISSLFAISRIFFKQVSSAHDILSVSGDCIHFTLKTCQIVAAISVTPVNFPNFFEFVFWRDFCYWAQPCVVAWRRTDGLTFTKAPLPATRLNMRAATAGIITPPARARGFSMTPGLGVLAYVRGAPGGGWRSRRPTPTTDANAKPQLHLCCTYVCFVPTSQRLFTEYNNKPWCYFANFGRKVINSQHCIVCSMYRASNPAHSSSGKGVNAFLNSLISRVFPEPLSTIALFYKMLIIAAISRVFDR